MFSRSRLKSFLPLGWAAGRSALSIGCFSGVPHFPAIRSHFRHALFVSVAAQRIIAVLTGSFTGYLGNIEILSLNNIRISKPKSCRRTTAGRHRRHYAYQTIGSFANQLAHRNRNMAFIVKKVTLVKEKLSIAIIRRETPIQFK